MKVKIIIGIATLAILGVGAFVVSGDGVKVNEEEMKRMRGTDGYYAHSEEYQLPSPYGEKELMVNLTDKGIVKIAFDLVYKVGLEWGEDNDEAMAAFMKNEGKIRSALIILFSNKRQDQFSGSEMLILQGEIRETINDIVFPSRMGRVEAVLFKDLVIQG